MDDLNSPDLSRQSLCRALTEEERALADSIEAAFAQGEHDLDALAARLQLQAVRRPSGEIGEWTVDVLEIELRSINRALDEAYARNGGKRIP
jgi:hypothetical protein